MGCGGGFVQVWPGKWAKTRVCVPNLREMWATGFVVAGLAAEAQKTAYPGMSRLFEERICWKSELSQVHVTLLGQGLVEGESFVQSVAGLTFLGNLEVVPHELFVVGVHAVLNNALGTLGG